MSVQPFARGSVVRAHDPSAGRLTPGDACLIVSWAGMQKDHGSNPLRLSLTKH